MKYNVLLVRIFFPLDHFIALWEDQYWYTFAFFLFTQNDL